MKRSLSDQEDVGSPNKEPRMEDPSSSSISPSDDDVMFHYDEHGQNDILRKKPWDYNLRYFKHVKISALALVKMVMHAHCGGRVEVMGLMQGKVNGDTIIVIDSFVLPVEGTETRVNAADDANEYMVEYVTMAKQVGRLENVVGWYHSHPDYGCWLSGIDVATQMSNQRWLDPFLAVVIDPTRTVSCGKVDIGAFRTYPEGYVPSDKSTREYESVPFNKIEDFGVHCKQYYSLDITYFKSHLDAHILKKLWDDNWMRSLSSPSLENKDFVFRRISDLAQKIEYVELLEYEPGSTVPSYSPKKEKNVAEVARISSKIAVEQILGQMSQVMQYFLINSFDEFKA